MKNDKIRMCAEYVLCRTKNWDIVEYAEGDIFDIALAENKDNGEQTVAIIFQVDGKVSHECIDHVNNIAFDSNHVCDEDPDIAEPFWPEDVQPFNRFEPQVVVQLAQIVMPHVQVHPSKVARLEVLILPNNHTAMSRMAIVDYEEIKE